MLVTGEKGSGKEVDGAPDPREFGPRRIHDPSRSSAPASPPTCSNPSCSATKPARFRARSRAASAASKGAVTARSSSAKSGALAPATQARLLAALQEQRFHRIGGDEAVPFHARLIASTSMDLEAAVSSGTLPRGSAGPPRPRPRRGSAAARARRRRRRNSPSISPPGSPKPMAIAVARASAMPRWCCSRRYGWPGNIRELEDCIHRAVLLAKGSMIEPQRPRPRRRHAACSSSSSPKPATCRSRALIGRTVEEVERELILQTLSAATATAPRRRASWASRCARCATSCARSSRPASPSPPALSPDCLRPPFLACRLAEVGGGHAHATALNASPLGHHPAPPRTGKPPQMPPAIANILNQHSA